MNELALFAGAGGGILGGGLLGWRTVCAVEIEPYAASVLLARQNQGLLPAFPIWDDVRTFDGVPWRGIVDVVSGGFPCQDISSAGNGEGISGSRSGLWTEFARIIREVRPQHAFVENSPLLTNRGLEKVLRDLAEMGYDAKWGVLSAEQAGASHKRERIWIVASDPNQDGLQGGDKRHAEEKRDRIPSLLASSPFPQSLDDIPKPYVLGGSHGVANRMDRTAAIGNGQVPAVVRLAWNTLKP